MSNARLAAAFARAKGESRPALISFVIPGFPSREGAEEAFDAMVAGGADIVEVEIPISDPLADGATIQGVVYQALEAGITPMDCLEFVRSARSRHPDVPIVVMTYLNPALAYGLDRFATDAAGAGADAVILTDLPPDEASSARAAVQRAGMDLIYLVAPTSSQQRMEMIGREATGFVYCVSVTGITGARTHLPPDIAEFIAKVRRCTNVPLAVGFGLSRREHVEALTGITDGVIVGSAYMDLLAKTSPAERAKAVREYTEVLSGRRRP